MLKNLANRGRGGYMSNRLSDSVLLIEDNAELVTNLEYILRVEGIAFRSALDGLTAIPLLRRYMPRVVVLDLYLPHMTGFEVLDYIRSNAGLAGTHVIVLSGATQSSRELESMADAADTHFCKPVDLDLLIDEIRRGLGQAQAGSAPEHP